MLCGKLLLSSLFASILKLNKNPSRHRADREITP
jgi:hypothetical protein